jgi:hypothetical protein
MDSTREIKYAAGPDLSVSIGRLKLKNPVMTASGTFGYGEEYAPFVDLNRLGAIIVKGLSLEPRLGNPPPRIMETPAGMLNAVGLQNIGARAFIAEKLPFLRQYDTAVVANIFGRPWRSTGAWPASSTIRRGSRPSRSTSPAPMSKREGSPSAPARNWLRK